MGFGFRGGMEVIGRVGTAHQVLYALDPTLVGSAHPAKGLFHHGDTETRRRQEARSVTGNQISRITRNVLLVLSWPLDFFRACRPFRVSCLSPDLIRDDTRHSRAVFSPCISCLSP